MKNITINIIALIAVSVLINCTSNTTEKNHPADDTASITLLNGEKWVVNEEMKPHIMAMEKSLSTFEGSSVVDYQLLGTTLKNNLDKLISSCTMDGQAHDELHVWLLPYMKSVNKLGKVNDANEGKELFNKLKTSIKTYKKHFQ